MRETERAVNRLARPAKERSASAGAGRDVRRLETELSDRLGATVRIDHRARGGRVIIRYHGVEELEGIIEQLGRSRRS